MSHPSLILLLLACACGNNSNAAARPQPVAPDRLSSYPELIRDLEAAALEGYGQLALGNTEAYADGIARGTDLTLIGLAGKQVIVGVDPPAAYGDRRLFRDRADLDIVSKNLRVALSRDESVGWTYDEVSYRLPIPVMRDGSVITERVASVPIRVSAAWVRDVDRWVQVMEHVSYPLAARSIVELARAGRLQAPAALADQPAAIDERTATQIRRVIEQLHGGPTDATIVVDDRRSLVVWPPPEQEHAGAQAAAAPALASLFGLDTRMEVTDVRVSTRLNTVAWAAANLSVEFGGADAGLSIGLRGTYVLEARKLEGEWRWQVVQAHISVPLSEQQVYGYVFGTTPTPQPQLPPPE